MNYPGTPYNDYILDAAYDTFGNNISNIMYTANDIMNIPGCELYSRLMKTTCCLKPSVREITQFNLISLVLVHYKYITVEQFRALMPWASPNMLSLYCKDIRNDRKKTESKCESASKRRKDIRLNAYNLEGASYYYMLTKGMYEDTISHIPAAYLNENRISLRAPEAPGSHALHQVLTNNTPLRMLRDSAFAPFCWFTNVALNPSLTIEDNLVLHGEDRTLLSNNGSAATDSKKPDGIISTEKNHGTYYCLVEQDMGTERSAKLNDKHRFYGELFKQETDCSNITVLINSARPLGDTKLKQRSPDYARQSTYRHALSKLKMTMLRNNLSSIAETKFFLLSETARKNDGLAHGNWLSIKSQLSLIDDYMYARENRPADDGVFSDIESFVDEVCSDAMYSKDENIYIQEKPRADKIREDLLSFVLSDKGAYLREAMLNKGLNYVVVNRIAFDRYAPVMLVKESSYADTLFDVIAGTSLMGYRDDCCHASHKGLINGYLFRNTFEFGTPDAPVTAFEEISCDVGGYLRAFCFAETYSGGGVPMNLILLVAKDGDATAFTKKSSLSRFFTDDADIPSRKYGVHVAFVNYAEKHPVPFIPTNEGGKKELLKYTDEMEERLCAR